MLLAALLIALSPQTPAAAPPPTAPVATAKFGLGTPIEMLMADARAKAVIDAEVPTLAGHPSYEMFKGMSLNDLAPMSAGALTDDMLKTIGAKLASLP